MMILSDICSYVSNKIKTSELDATNYISTENMLPNKMGIENAANLPTTEYTPYYQKNDILISNIRPYFKKIWHASFMGGCSNDVLIFRAKSNIDPVYLYYILSDDSFFNYSMSTSKGTKMPRGDKTALMNYSVPNFDYHTQCKIGSVLRTIDSKIELNQRINNNLEQQAQALFDNMFPLISYGNYSIGHYIKPKKGKNLLSKDAIKGNVPVVAGGLSPSTYHNNANTNAPVITISASGANAGYVQLWYIPVWSSDSSFIDSEITPNIYFWAVLLKKRQQEIFESQTGSAQPHIYPQHIEAMPLAKLDSVLVSKFHNNVTPIFSLIGQNIEENTRLSELRDTLLPKLMTGEIDVSKVDISELISADKSSFIIEYFFVLSILISCYNLKIVKIKDIKFNLICGE